MLYINFSTNKEKGNAGLAMAISYFVSQGYTVSIPLNDTQDYDLVIDKNNSLKGVQVKATGFKTKSNIYQISIRSFGGTKGKEYKTIINTNVDFVFIVTKSLDMYLIPKLRY